jgi:hypothetical protein
MRSHAMLQAMVVLVQYQWRPASVSIALVTMQDRDAIHISTA